MWRRPWELKIQFPPLTKYQMRIWWKTGIGKRPRLKAVEQEYRAGKRPADYEPVPEKKTEVSPQSYMARQEAAFAAEPEAEYPEDGYRKVDTQKAGIRRTDTQKTNTRKTDTQMMGMQRTDIRKAGMRKTDIRRRDTQNAGIGMTGMPRMSIRMTDIQKQDTRRTIIQSVIIRKADIRQRHIQEDTYTDEDGSEEVYARQGLLRK